MTENASGTAGPVGVHLSSGKLAQMIDISAVQAFHTEDDIRGLANLALKSGFIAAHALPTSCHCSGHSFPWAARRLLVGR